MRRVPLPDERQEVDVPPEATLAPAISRRLVTADRAARGLGPAAIATIAVIVVVLASQVTASASRTSGASEVPTTASTRPAKATPASGEPASSLVTAVVIPWLSQPYVAPTPDPTTPPAELPLCGSDQLEFLAQGWGGATGSAAGAVTLINVSGDPCHLEKPTAVGLVDASGAEVADSGREVNGESSSANVTAMRSGAAAEAIAVWDNWCGPPPAQPFTMRLTLHLADPDGHPAALTLSTTVSTASRLTPRCDEPTSPSSISLLPFRPQRGAAGDYDRKDCEPADLAGYVGTWRAAMETWYSTVVIRNDSGLDCNVPASAAVELRDPAGSLLSTNVPVETATVGTLPAVSTLTAQIGISNWCSAPPAGPLRLDVLLETGRVPVDSVSRGGRAIPIPDCMSAPATPRPTFFSSALRDPFLGDPPVDDPIESLPFRVDLAVPPVARPGTTLVYEVRLTNTSPYGKPINLSAMCPGYTERLFAADGSTTTDVLALNCQAAGVIAAGDSRTFEMQLAIPKTVPAGPGEIVWQLGQRGPANKIRLQIGTVGSNP